ncbi:hypothetical protein B0H13DRAFT_2021292 [Mycena leptocephala]|nr:hypothetical protein B0H13DRAFT_2021292 [Mycena leptocephala]
MPRTPALSATPGCRQHHPALASDAAHARAHVRRRRRLADVYVDDAAASPALTSTTPPPRPRSRRRRRPLPTPRSPAFTATASARSPAFTSTTPPRLGSQGRRRPLARFHSDDEAPLARTLPAPRSVNSAFAPLRSRTRGCANVVRHVLRTALWVRAASAQRRPPSLSSLDHAAPALHAPSARVFPASRAHRPIGVTTALPPPRSPLSPHLHPRGTLPARARHRALALIGPPQRSPSRCSPHAPRSSNPRPRSRPRTAHTTTVASASALVAPSPPSSPRLCVRARPRAPPPIALALVAPSPMRSRSSPPRPHSSPPRSPSAPSPTSPPLSCARHPAHATPPPRSSPHLRVCHPASA